MVYYALIDFFHLLATVIWLGGIFYLNLVLMPSINTIAPPERSKLMFAVSSRFTVLAWISIIFLIITGILKAGSEEVKNLTPTEHVFLSIKYSLFAIMLVVGIVITFYLGPKIKTLSPKEGEKPSVAFLKAQNQLNLLAKTNMVLGVFVLIFVSFT